MIKSIAVLSLLASTAYGHAFISSVQSANGVSAMSFGVDTTGSIPRNGTTEQPFQLDTPVLKDLNTNPCGSTLMGGSIDIATAMKNQAQASNGALPQVPSNGTLTLGIHQVNADGGGPFTAEVNADGTGKTWVAATVMSQPPGSNGLLHNGPANSFLTLQMPKNVQCTGGTGNNACLVRINNGGENSTSFANGAGPFGGCVAVSMAATSTKGGSAAKSTITPAAQRGHKGQAGKANNNGAKKNNANKRSNVLSSRSLASLDELSDMLVKRNALDLSIEQKRQILTAQLIDELGTVTGTALDIPIDNIAGQNDFSAKGGNSTTVAKNAVLTEQQAIDLKKAVNLAVNSAIQVLANAQNIDAGKEGQDEEITDKANADAAAFLASGQTTSVNLGNAGVGFFNTANVNSLMGELATATDGLKAAAATTTAAGAKATSGSNRGANKGGNANKGAANNGAANRGGANNGAANGASRKQKLGMARVRRWD
ncbi:hypothetical protein OE88DRAFT_1502016 [Heliocybe sulcata]|uniref:Uncharacterized protein n=1 Tax=Heliocybe sulcata TaxID=5364 RepID=A0A5C3N5F7_9AGAM|nr:hypothetical protein OE88DRAFT_1502016 [Heliocybe sulcata]